jgi:hypothetical protein
MLTSRPLNHSREPFWPDFTPGKGSPGREITGRPLTALGRTLPRMKRSCSIWVAIIGIGIGIAVAIAIAIGCSD